MCKDCGCESANAKATGHAHPHAHPHDPGHGHSHAHSHGGDAPHPHEHPHDHGHAHPHDHGGPDGHGHTHETDDGIRRIEMERSLLARNDEIAARNRAWLTQRGIVTLNLISSPGSGKTMLLERTLDRLRGRLACAVVTGDLQTDNDARRLADRGAPVRQIETRSSCHLNAGHLRDVLPEVAPPGTRLLFIENVGNLVCPAAFDLGEHFKVALLSVTEGEDKPLKYPTLFSAAQVAILTKTDLIPALDWNLAECRKALQAVHPGMFVFELSAKTGDGMDGWIEYLVRLAG
ncbi:MAG: hydrogenase nickel incorporation protein HypB [Verrucomicrobia bacterium]|nr:hydrogenase nickel incorporation protein HypB [Verrucomicrobiota bacterium]